MRTDGDSFHLKVRYRERGNTQEPAINPVIHRVASGIRISHSGATRERERESESEKERNERAGRDVTSGRRKIAFFLLGGGLRGEAKDLTEKKEREREREGKKQRLHFPRNVTRTNYTSRELPERACTRVCVLINVYTCVYVYVRKRILESFSFPVQGKGERGRGRDGREGKGVLSRHV